MRSIIRNIFMRACPTAHAQWAIRRGPSYMLLLRRKAIAQSFSEVSAAIPHALPTT